MDGAADLLGLFLLVMAAAMLAMDWVYFKTGKMKIGWMAFGALYSVGLLGLLTDNPIKDCLKIAPERDFYSVASLVLLALGIMLSFLLCGKKGEKHIVAGILLSVAVHFFPFHTVYTYILGIAAGANALYFFVKPHRSIFKTILVDALLKGGLGFFLIFVL